MNTNIFTNFSRSGSHIILVFPHQSLWQYSEGNPPNGGVECSWGTHKSRLSASSWLSIDDQWLLKCEQQRWPSTVSLPHRWWHISESMFITTSMDDHDKGNRTEFICMQQ